jgi:hypothetical protein
MASGSLSPFRPTGTTGLLAGVASMPVQLVGGGDSVVVTNTSSSLAYIRFGSDMTVTATSSDMPILPSSRVLLCVNSLITSAAALLALGTGTVLFTRGDGSFL